jgi:ATP-dependent Clp protease ATP-binding subunit ClpC
MFERFTDRARHVIVLAQEEARLLNHSYIGTEHLLLGLVHEQDGVAARALEALGISLTAVRTEVEQMIGRGEGMPSGHIPFTPRAKKVLELSLREALRLDHNYIGTEHILLGLIREGDGVAAQVLTKLGAGHEQVRQKVLDLLHQDRTGEGTGPRRVIGRRFSEMGSSITGRLEEVLTRLDHIEHRLTSIERAIGGTGGGHPPAGAPGAGPAAEPGAVAGPPGLGATLEPLDQPAPAGEPPPGEPPEGDPPAGEPPAAGAGG